MAASCRYLLKPWTPSVCFVRWSRYNPYYLDPDPSKDALTHSKSDLSPEEKELNELKTVSPIKAALSSATSSPFNDTVISKFINTMMQDGKKVLARGIMTQTLENIKRKQVEKYHKSHPAKREEIECNPYAIFHQALENCKPIIGLASIQKGGKFYQVNCRALNIHFMISEI
ncbi:28S ribosomal protein S7, mitochondrial-like [Xyrauchen texanus]|uniref:28S ribosomal protein S7, mitochondrial-like n=1 Tax=Xyrauchen texanus TaxID=154827 RepID=UPI002242B619|nr:28S ribosomal protein S7, mitochondrial-like [Xyrauchen texanus]